jgi:hypothetical protein
VAETITARLLQLVTTGVVVCQRCSSSILLLSLLRDQNVIGMRSS